MYVMNTVTINVTLPRPLMLALRRRVKSGWYASVSEALRDGARRVIGGEETLSEEEALKAAAEPVDMSDAWDGKGSFVDWALSGRSKSHGKGKKIG